jgi:hypothetical protein
LLLVGFMIPHDLEHCCQRLRQPQDFFNLFKRVPDALALRSDGVEAEANAIATKVRHIAT